MKNPVAKVKSTEQVGKVTGVKIYPEGTSYEVTLPSGEKVWFPDEQLKTYHLGKAPADVEGIKKTLKFSTYSAGMPAPPPEVSWVVKVPKWPMHLNDKLGDCVPAGAAHCIEQWTFFASGTELIVPDPAVLKAYEDVGGYRPDDPNSDNGCKMLTMVKYLVKTGIDGHKIAGFVSVNPKNLVEVFQAIQLFGNLYVGVLLPTSAQGESAWTVPDGGLNGENAPGTWGGHCVMLGAASPKTITCVTWGELLKMSHNFFLGTCDEAYVLLSHDWVKKIGQTPSGFDFATLQKDLAQFN